MPKFALLAVAVVAAVAIYALAWRATRASSTPLKVLARAALPVVLAPVLVLVALRSEVSHDFGDVEAPRSAFPPSFEVPSGTGGAPPDEGSPTGGGMPRAAEPPDELEKLDEEKAPKKSKRPTAADAESEEAEPSDVPGAAPTEAPAAVPPEDDAAVGPRPYMYESPPPAAANGGTPPPPAAAPEPAPETAPPATRGLEIDKAAKPDAPAPFGAAAPSAEEWDVVPVFYGTDRARAANDKRLDYGSDRGRRLELGRALVTVPKAHEVPAIERPWAIRIPLVNVTLYEEAEDPKSHFTMKEIKALSEEELLALVRARLAASSRYKDHAFIFIHGYNTGFDYAIYRTAQIAYDLKFDGAPFAYSWPSGGGIASYTYDRESSGQSEPYLRQFFDLVVSKTGAKAVSVIAHSMGNQPTLQVLRDLRASKPDHVIINQVVLAAPDVDRDNFENIAQQITGLAKGVTLYAAANDRALIASRNFYGGIPRAGDVPPTGPLVLPGIDTIDVTAASLDSLALNHSSYAENKALLADIALLLLNGGLPPTRTPTLEEILTEKGRYWRFPAGR